MNVCTAARPVAALAAQPQSRSLASLIRTHIFTQGKLLHCRLMSEGCLSEARSQFLLQE